MASVPENLSAVPLHAIPLHAADILENINDAVVALDRDWRILYANREACRINRKTSEEFVGKVHWEEWPAAVGTEIETHLRRAMDEGVAGHFEYRYVLDPYDVWLENDVYPTENGVNIFYRDITERKQAEVEMKRSEQRYRSLIDATAEIVWTNSPEGAMRGPQPGWSSFTGQTQEECQSYGWAQAVHPEDAQPTVDAWNAAVAARKPFLFEHRVRRHDGEYRTFAIRAVAVLEDGGGIREWVGVHTDVTERRALEASRNAMMAQQKSFLRDVLASVTGNRLRLCFETGDLPAKLWPQSDWIAVSATGGLWELRHRAKDAAVALGFADDRWQDLITAASEAAMNAVVHAGEGRAQVCGDGGGVVQVWVEDEGQGIDVARLPRATLEKGFTTAGTLGHGMKMMLQTADRVFLLTGPLGTTVVAEQDRIAPPAAW